MIGLLSVLVALTVLIFEFYVSRKTKSEAACKVWVKESRSNEWMCVDKLK